MNGRDCNAKAIRKVKRRVHDAQRGPFHLGDRELTLGISTASKTPKKKSPTEQYIFQRRTSTPTESSGHDESSSLYAELGLTVSETESDEEVLRIIARVFTMKPGWTETR
ncbi:hypothetical protein Tco_0343085 [Tanacetum coccineum]